MRLPPVGLFALAVLATCPELARATPPSTGRTVRGQVFLVDKRGVERLAGSGQVLVALFDEVPNERESSLVYVVHGDRDQRTLPLVDGRWELPEVEAAAVRVVSADLTGLGSYISNSQQERPNPDRSGDTDVITVCLASEFVKIHIFDAWTRMPLDRIDVLRRRNLGETLVAPNWRHGIAPPVGEGTAMVTVGSGLTAPLLLTSPPQDALRPSYEYWVRAPGHAWSRVLLKQGESGEHRVLAHPVHGSLEVFVDVHEQDEYQLVFQFGNRTGSVGDIARYGTNSHVNSGVHVFDGLLPSRYYIYLSSRDRPWRALDSKAVTILPGKNMRVDLSAPSRADLVRVEGPMEMDPPHMGILDPLGMVVFFAEGDNVAGFGENRGECSVKAGEDWSMDLLPGSYRAFLRGSGEVGRFEVPTSEPVILRQKPTPVAMVTLSRPEELALNGIHWRTVGSPEAASRHEWDLNSPVYFLAPVGEIEIVLYSGRGEVPGLRRAYRWRKTVATHGSEIRLELPFLDGIVDVVLLDGAEPFSRKYSDEIPDLLCGDSFAELEDGIAHFVGVEPGRQELHIPPIPGFWTPKPRSIDVPESGELQVEIKLERLD